MAVGEKINFRPMISGPTFRTGH